MKFHPASLALLFVPSMLAAQSAPPPEPAPEAGPLSLENRTALRCAAAFAIIADGQARGNRKSLAYPALGERGREFFVRTSARVMDDTGMDRDAVAAVLLAQAQGLRQDGDPEGKMGGDIDQIMPACLLLLEASGI